MWHQYRCELFPQYEPPFDEVAPAAVEPGGRTVLFSEFFRQSRDGQKRGIVRIIPEVTP
jgi:hypothetical protein